jgi:hypothetical protein
VITILKSLSRWFLLFAALLLLLGAIMHTSAFPRTQSAVAAAPSLAPFFGQSLKALWLIDSVTLLTLSGIFSLAALSPGSISGLLVALLALVPVGTAILLYVFLGRFAPAHLLLLAGLLALTAGMLRTFSPNQAMQRTAGRRASRV